MVVDHMGLVFFPEYRIFQIITRPAFITFAFTTAFSVSKTRNTPKFLFRLFILALISQAPYSWFMYTIGHSIFNLNIFFTLCLGVVAIMIIKQKDKLAGAILGAFYLLFVLLISLFVTFDYSFAGVLLIVLFYLAITLSKNKYSSVLFFTIALLIFNLVFSLFYGFGIQWYSMVTIILLALFTSKKPKPWKYEKWIFYPIYPLHLFLLCVVALFV
jgi:hypothetical protein